MPSPGPTVHLSTLAPFHSLPPRVLALVAAEVEELVYEPEAWLTRRGDEPDAMYMVVDGQVRALGAEEERLLGPGETVGFPDLFVPGARSDGLLALTEVLALRLATDPLRELCERNFVVTDALLGWLGGRVVGNAAWIERAVAGLPDGAGPLPPLPLRRVRNMMALQRAPALPLRSMDALAELAERVGLREVDEGAELWEEGGIARRFWVVVSGRVDLVLEARRFPLSVGGAPGLPEMLSGLPYRGRAEVIEPAALVEIDVDPFMDVLEDHFELAFALLGWLGWAITLSAARPSF